MDVTLNHRGSGGIPSALTGFFFWLIEQSIQACRQEKAERGRTAEGSKMPESRSERRMNSASSTASMLPWHSEKRQPERCRESRTHTAMGICTQHSTTLRKSSMSRRTLNEQALKQIV